MKTLDEVIDNFEKACDLERRCEGCSGCLGQENGCPNDGAESVPDALHYLKVLQKMQRAQPVTKGEWDELYNDPLTWEELLQMEGKPIWLEQYDPIDEKTGWHTASWYLLEFINDEYFDVRNSDGEQYCFYKDERWQAYRKER